MVHSILETWFKVHLHLAFTCYLQVSDLSSQSYFRSASVLAAVLQSSGQAGPLLGTKVAGTLVAEKEN